jgi:hypothetical protein
VGAALILETSVGSRIDGRGSIATFGGAIRGRKGELIMDMNITKEPQQEGAIARGIERQTSRIPSDLFLWTGLAAIGTSLTLALMGRQKVANFIGQWVPTVLLFGVYNKIVKVAGHDVRSRDVH